MYILVPISSSSSFFPASEYFFPKPLIEIVEKPMIELVIGDLKRQFPNGKFIFVVEKADIVSFSLDHTLRLLAGEDSKILEKQEETHGALCSCLLSIDEIPADKPLVIVNSDQIIDFEIQNVLQEFSEFNAAAGVITFESVHPRWSFIKDDGMGNVVESCEKSVISKSAIAGFYYFDTASRFFEAAKKVILKGSEVNGQYYISSTINEVILSDSVVRHFEIPSASYHSFYSPAKILEFEHTQLARDVRNQPDRVHRNILIPAAGAGSRFAREGWKKPKPFIDINGQPMIHHVHKNLKIKDAVTTIILREQDRDINDRCIADLQRGGVRVEYISTLTEGTACSVLSAHRLINNDDPLLIANSDQLIDFDISVFIDDCENRGLDGSILVFKDPNRDPKWSFARVEIHSGLVEEVAEKQPISDLATVGIYYFARGKDFINAALDMLVKNDRVNGEFYTCPVYNYMIKKGARIGCYELAYEKVFGIGTPSDLVSYMNNNNMPHSQDMP